MKVKITQKLSNYHHVIGREPSTAVWTKGVHKVKIENGKFEIDYEVVEKEGIQHLELPVGGLHKIVIEFSRF